MRIFKYIVLLSFIFVLCSSNAYASMDYKVYAEVLREHVNGNGEVNYTALKKDRLKMDIFVGIIARTDISKFDKAEKMAFWINAYNVLTLQTIVDHYPIKSIKNISKVWDTKKNVALGKYTLNEIEHEIVRPMGDPRIHFALNCASIGCPKLPNKPFMAETLDEQLHQETLRFINDNQKVKYDYGKKVLELSSIFKWFKEDFISVSPDLRLFVAKYLDSDQAKLLKAGEAKIKYMKYDWGLNEQ